MYDQSYSFEWEENIQLKSIEYMEVYLFTSNDFIESNTDCQKTKFRMLLSLLCIHRCLLIYLQLT